MHSTSLLFILSSTLLSRGAFAAFTELNIVNTELAPDGFTRDTVVANGQFPGPVISGNKGDNFQINVNNQLKDESMLLSTSIHWHGIFQDHTSWADGPAFVTQCPIAQNHSFLYDFNVPNQAGTYWYHSHLGTQYCDGLRGPLIVKDPHDPYLGDYDVDDDSTIITLADWYHVVAPQVTVPPTADSQIINGKGRFLNTTTNEVNDAPLAIVNVQHGKRYRFRLINIACDPNYQFSIDGHTMTIIEADGVNTQPLTVDQIQIFAAQRYSFILTANQPVGNYWMRSLPNDGISSNTTEGGLNSAILRYAGAPAVDPNTTSTVSNPLVETNLHPLTNPAAPGKPFPGGADHVIPMAFDLVNGTAFTINNYTFVPPTVPVLLQILSDAQSAANLMPAGSIYSLKPNQVVEIQFSGLTLAGPHPFHLHGHTFSVVRSAGNSSYNFVDPVQRDTVNTGNSGDNVTIRFVTDNPGPWFLHCHIDWHLNAGFAAVMAEDVPDIPHNTSPPASWDQLCPIYDKLTPQQIGGIVPSS